MIVKVLKMASSSTLMSNKKIYLAALSAFVIVLSLLQAQPSYAASNDNELTKKQYQKYKKRLIKTGLYEDKDGTIGGTFNLSDGTTGRVLDFTKNGELILLKPAVNRDSNQETIYIKIKYSIEDVKKYLSRQEATYGE